VFTKADGTEVIGRVVGEEGNSLKIMASPMAPDALLLLPKRDIRSKKPSKVSPMMPALFNPLNRDEVLDLMAYLLSGGKANSKEFK
jgi:hypothetical protein